MHCRILGAVHFEFTGENPLQHRRPHGVGVKFLVGFYQLSLNGRRVGEDGVRQGQEGVQVREEEAIIKCMLMW